MSTHPNFKNSLPLNSNTGDNSSVGKLLAILAYRLDQSALAISTAPLPHIRWSERLKKKEALPKVEFRLKTI